MRVRVGNPFRDQHYNWSSHVYEFITWPDRPPHEVVQAIEYALDDNNHRYALFGRGTHMPERVYDRERVNLEIDPSHRDYGTHWFSVVASMQDGDPDKQGWVDGAVFTSWQQEESEHEPCLYVAITLYDQGCTNNVDCIAGHKGYICQAAPALSLSQTLAIEEEIGVHNKYYLGKNPQQDIDILSGFGWTPIDAPCKDEPIGNLYKLEHLYKALDYVALSKPSDFDSKVMMLHNAGYVLDASLVGQIARTRKVDLAYTR